MAERRAIYKVDEARIWTVKTNPLGLSISVAGAASTPKWSEFELTPAVYVMPPVDGIYDIFWTGLPPDEIVPEVITPVEFVWTWIGFPETHLKGVRVHSDTNVVETLLDHSREPA